MKDLAADIVLIWKDIIVETSNDLHISNCIVNNNNYNKNNNYNNYYICDKKYLSSPPNKSSSSKNMMKHIDPNIDIEESEDSVSNNAVPQSPISSSPSSGGLIKTTNSPGNVFEKLKPTELKDSFFDAISSADKSLTDINKRPKTAKSYPSKFRSGELCSGTMLTLLSFVDLYDVKLLTFVLKKVFLMSFLLCTLQILKMIGVLTLLYYYYYST